MTALVLLLPGRSGSAREDADHAVSWLLSQTVASPGSFERLRWRLLGVRARRAALEGWPWFPGAAAWVTPTALTTLALEKQNRRSTNKDVRERIAQGRAFCWPVVARMEVGTTARPRRSAMIRSYPETTGIALLALHDVRNTATATAEDLTQKPLATCRSLEGACWLTLALWARGRVSGVDRAVTDATSVDDGGRPVSADEGSGQGS